MILTFSLMTSIYGSYQILGFGKSEHNQSNLRMKYKQPIKTQSRITIFSMIFQFLWLSNIYSNFKNTDNLIYLDGQCKINKFILISELYQIILIQIILYIIGKDYTIQISKRSEQFQMLITNFISQIQQQNSNDQIITIITWEQMNQSQYLQITMQGNTNTGTSLSAGIKYFQLSAQTTAFLQMGISQIYSKTGNLNYDIQIAIMQMSNISSLPTGDVYNVITLYIGQILIIITFMFKQSAAPFHYWAPDLYDSQPTPILIYVIIIPKITIIIFLYLILFIINHIITFTFINIIAIICVIIGSIGLSSQWRIKRFLTYSAISHLGFILLAYISFSWDSYFYYLYFYGITNLIIFQILQSIGSNQKGNDDDIIFIKEQSGIFNMNPFIAILQAQALFSQAGIPPLIGFFQKFQIILGIIDGTKINQSIFIIQGSVISTLNYLTIIKYLNINSSSLSGKIYQKYSNSQIISQGSIIQIFSSMKYHIPMIFLSSISILS